MAGATGNHAARKVTPVYDALTYLILAAAAIVALFALPLIITLAAYVAPIAIAIACGLWLYHAL